jgi:hypothetical protein
MRNQTWKRRAQVDHLAPKHVREDRRDISKVQFGRLLKAKDPLFILTLQGARRHWSHNPHVDIA